jgi:hypothetical protein
MESMKLLELRPTRVYFACTCGQRLEFTAVDRLGEANRIRCPRCSATWEQRLTAENGDRGWTKTLLSPQPPRGRERPGSEASAD